MKKRIFGAAAALIIVGSSFFSAVLACCSVAPAKFNNTTGWVGETHKDGHLVHILAYENVAENLNFGDTAHASALHGNAMILPIPAVSDTMTEKNLLDGHDFKGLIKALYKSSRDPIQRALDDINAQLNSLNSFSTRGTLQGSAPVVQVFDRGSYTVVLSNSAAAIPDAVSRVPENKRPPINRELFEAYDKWYPGWSFALCCFDRSVGDPEPLVWWYEPRDPNQLFFPAVDEHSGGVPQMDTLVAVDHHLAVTSDMMANIPEGFGAVHPVRFDEETGFGPTAKPYVPLLCMGTAFSGKKLQGDFTFNTWDVRAGIFRPHRTPPPGAAANAFLPFFSDLGEDKYARVYKVLIGWVLAGVAMLFFLRWRVGLSLILLSPIVFFLMAWHFRDATPDTVPVDMINNLIVSIAFIALAFFPIRLIAKDVLFKSRSLMIATAVVILLAFLFPGWSSPWYPLAFMIVAILAATEYRQAEQLKAQPIPGGSGSAGPR